MRLVGLRNDMQHFQQGTVARQMRMVFQDAGTPSYILRDGDTKFTAQFKSITESEGAVLKKLPFCSPNLNAYAEAWVGKLRAECLDRFVIVSPEHLWHVVKTYVAYHHSVRPHRADGQRPLGIGKMPRPERVETKNGIACDCWLGGLLRHYRRVG